MLGSSHHGPSNKFLAQDISCFAHYLQKDILTSFHKLKSYGAEKKYHHTFRARNFKLQLSVADLTLGITMLFTHFSIYLYLIGKDTNHLISRIRDVSTYALTNTNRGSITGSVELFDVLTLCKKVQQTPFKANLVIMNSLL